MIIVDTDVLIWILRGRIDIKEKMLEFIQDISIKLFITPIQISEIYAGLKENEKIKTSLFLDSFPCITIDSQIGKLAGEYVNKYKKSHGVTVSDSLIAACSKIHNLQLWTLNIKHYPMLGKDDIITLKK